jgi:hypothetical protein
MSLDCELLPTNNISSILLRDFESLEGTHWQSVNSLSGFARASSSAVVVNRPNTHSLPLVDLRGVSGILQVLKLGIRP